MPIGTPVPGWDPSSGGRGWNSSTTIRCGVPPGCATSRWTPAAGWCGSRGRRRHSRRWPGKNLRTTIDLDLQLFVDSIWPKGQLGALVAMTPNGEIRALYSTPAYDPNDFIGGISSAEWRRLNGDPSLPLLNRALQVKYPPGSPFKLATAIMGLRRGLVGFDSHMPQACTGVLQYGNRAFKCWDKRGHGSLDLTRAIALSCDVYFYQLGLRVQLANMLTDGVSMGFGDRTHVDLVNEVGPDLARLHRMVRQALRSPRLEQCGDAESRHRAGREHPDADEHGAVLRRPRRGLARRRRRTWSIPTPAVFMT